MRTAEAGPPESHIACAIVDAAYKVQTTLGPGLFGSALETVLACELGRCGCHVERQVPIAVRYDHLVLDIGFGADRTVDGLVIVELTSVQHVAAVHKKQTLTITRLADKRLGLLINFGARRLKDGITRLANNLPH